MHSLLAAVSGLLLLALPQCSATRPDDFQPHIYNAGIGDHMFSPTSYVPGQSPSKEALIPKGELTTAYGAPAFMLKFEEYSYCGFVDGPKFVNHFGQRHESARVQELCRQLVRHCQQEAETFCEGEEEGCNEEDKEALGNRCFFNALPEDPGFYERLTSVSTGGEKLSACVVQRMIEPYVNPEDLPFFMCLAHKKSKTHGKGKQQFSTKGTGLGHFNNGYYGLFGLSSKHGWCVKDSQSQKLDVGCPMKCSQSENFNLKDDLRCVFNVFLNIGIDGFGDGTHKECCPNRKFRYNPSRICKSKYADPLYNSFDEDAFKETPPICENSPNEEVIYEDIYYQMSDPRSFFDGDKERQLYFRQIGAPLPVGLDATPMLTYENLFGDEETDSDIVRSMEEELEDMVRTVELEKDVLSMNEELLKRARRMAEAVVDFLEVDDAIVNGDASVTRRRRRSTKHGNKRKGRVSLTDELKYKYDSDFDEEFEEKCPTHADKIGKAQPATPFSKRSADEDYYPRDDDADEYDESDNESLYDVPKRTGKTRSAYNDDDVDQSRGGNDDVAEARDEQLPSDRQRRQSKFYSPEYKCAMILDPKERATYKGGKICSDARIKAYLNNPIGDW